MSDNEPRDREQRADHDAPVVPELPRWARPSPTDEVLSDDRMLAYFGPKWETSYKRKLAPFFADPSFVPTWNWPAAIAFPPAWFLYRKLYLPFALFFLVPGFVFRILTGSDTPQTMAEMSKPENEWLKIMSIAVMVSSSLAAGGTANWFLFRRARAANRFVAMQQLPEPETLALMRRMGGVNRSATSLYVALIVIMTLMKIAG
ncbi:MAG: DUF2628 domain-containing protein [Gemmatimonas sp.]|uniref:DUF2628 domain-containing protein n=1 Tax=Gemmatimonas sp. TaxID=1962908 RepID=UPI0031C3028E|nr:DUF2628 domain-containing protein [Gemmatimonas sp.]